jgi:FAD/FMN-containing dehydrogenase
MSASITSKDSRFSLISKTRNARWPAKESELFSRIELCESADDVAEALQRVISAGKRPTVRAGGHCYEDFFANNPDGVLIDVSMLNQTVAGPGGKGPYKVGAGAPLGTVYLELFKKGGVTVPAGSCTSVGAGGHISGGGYGVLTRLYGLTVDYLVAVDICTVDAGGKVIKRHVDKTHDADLFRALRGGGGANFGVITAFYLDNLPLAPVSQSSAGVNFSWDTMTEEKFIHIVQTYGNYFETRGKDPETWPMFNFMGLNYKNPGGGGGIGISATWHNFTETPDLRVPTEFLDLFVKCGDAEVMNDPQLTSHQRPQPQQQGRGRGGPQQGPMTPCILGEHRWNTSPWIQSTIGGGGGGAGAFGGGPNRGKYKSCYMKKNFTTAEAKTIYKQLTRDVGAPVGGIIAVDSYGGATNKPALANETAIPQRASVMKLQYQQYWSNPAEDAARLKYFDEMYTDIYSQNVDKEHAGTPWHNEYYEGCYINYPDADMLRYPFWTELYYGTGDHYKFLQSVKKKYDPNNIFHHSMTVRA